MMLIFIQIGKLRSKVEGKAIFKGNLTPDSKTGVGHPTEPYGILVNFT